MTEPGRHRAPPPRDRWTAPIGASAALLTAASLIAVVAPAVAPDATAAVSTVTRTARTVQIPLTILPPVTASTPSVPAGARQTWSGVSVEPEAAETTATGLSEVRAAIPTADRPQATTPEATSRITEGTR